MGRFNSYRIAYNDSILFDGQIYTEYGSVVGVRITGNNEDIEYLNSLGYLGLFKMVYVILKQWIRASRRKEVDEFNKKCQKQL